jgi:YD repeat-containing protein
LGPAPEFFLDSLDAPFSLPTVPCIDYASPIDKVCKKSATPSHGTHIRRAFTATGRPSTLTQPNGVGVTYAYDLLDRVTSTAWKNGTSPAFASWGYAYNERGQRTSATDIAAREASYAYDQASRLTSETITGDPSGATGNGALTYVIDPDGNRLSRTSTLAALAAQSFSYDPNGELASDVDDPNGNTTSSGVPLVIATAYHPHNDDFYKWCVTAGALGVGYTAIDVGAIIASGAGGILAVSERP